MTSAVPGTFCLVLHSHLPWLPGHGVWPLGEEWLHQAMVESYLPVVAELDSLAAEGHRDVLTLGVTPVLAAQLDHRIEVLMPVENARVRSEVHAVGHYPMSPLPCPHHDVGDEKPVGTAHIEKIAITVDGFHQRRPLCHPPCAPSAEPRLDHGVDRLQIGVLQGGDLRHEDLVGTTTCAGRHQEGAR